MNNPHDILGLLPSATEEEIKATYRKLARKYLEEAQSDDPATARLAERELREVNEAYAVLCRSERPTSAKAVPPPLPPAPVQPTPPPPAPSVQATYPAVSSPQAPDSNPIPTSAHSAPTAVEPDDTIRYMRWLRWLVFIQALYMVFVILNVIWGPELPSALQKFDDEQEYMGRGQIPLGVALLVSAVTAYIGLVCRQAWARTLYFGLCVIGYAVLPMMNPTYIDIEYEWYDMLDQLTTLMEGFILALLYFSPLKQVFSKST